MSKAVDKGGTIVNGVLQTAGTVARKAANTLEKAAPVIEGVTALVAPEFAPVVAEGLTSATTLARAAQTGARTGQSITNSLATRVNNGTNNVLSGAHQNYNLLSQGLQAKMGVGVGDDSELQAH